MGIHQAAITSRESLTIAVVDDDEINVHLLNKTLKDAGHDVIQFTSANDAWAYFQETNISLDVIFLDKRMPEMDGIELLKKIKAHPNFKNVPVILQTGETGLDIMQEGMRAGAYYYLSKPFHPPMLLSLVETAYRDIVAQHELTKLLEHNLSALSLLQGGVFHLKNLEEARKLSAILGREAKEAERISIGIMELITNAIEHGNLEIDYDAKKQLLSEGRWEEEINHRLTLDAYKERKVCIRYTRSQNKIILDIVDEGNGFNWEEFLEFDPSRMTDPNGRGIALAQTMGLQDIHYNQKGNQVICFFYIKPEC